MHYLLTLFLFDALVLFSKPGQDHPSGHVVNLLPRKVISIEKLLRLAVEFVFGDLLFFAAVPSSVRIHSSLSLGEEREMLIGPS